MENKKEYKLTPKQEKAFGNLQCAIDRCLKNDIYLWDDYGSISGVNGKVVHFVAPDRFLGEPIDQNQVARIEGLNILSNADDSLFVRRHFVTLPGQVAQVTNR